MLLLQPVVSIVMVVVPIVAALLAVILQLGHGRCSASSIYRLAMGATITVAVVAVLAAILLLSGAWSDAGSSSVASMGAGAGAGEGSVGTGSAGARSGLSSLLRLDGINVFPVLLLAGFGPLILLALRNRIVFQDLVKMPVQVLLMEGLFLGAFLANHLGLFFFFMESTVVLLILVAGMWGSEKRVGTAWKIAIFHMLGSVTLGSAVLFINVAGAGGLAVVGGQMPVSQSIVFVQTVLFCIFFLWAAIRMGLPPFHSWLIDLFSECPPALGLIVAVGGGHGAALGLVRFALPLLPHGLTASLPVLVWVVVGCLLYGALVAVVQQDFRRPAGLWSSAFMGAFLLGIFTMTQEGLTSALFALVVNGLVLGGLAFTAEALISRRQRSSIHDFGGIARRMPVLAVILLVFLASATLVPGFAGFVTAFGVASSIRFSQAMDSVPVIRWLAAAVLLTAIIWAVTMFWGYGRMMFGPLKNPLNWGLRDLDGRERSCLIPLAVLLGVLGFFPQLIFNAVQPDVVSQMGGIMNPASGKFMPVDGQEQEAPPGGGVEGGRDAY